MSKPDNSHDETQSSQEEEEAAFPRSSLEEEDLSMPENEEIQSTRNGNTAENHTACHPMANTPRHTSGNQGPKDDQAGDVVSQVQAKEKLLQPRGQKSCESAVEVFIKETLQEMPLGFSEADMDRLEQEIEARVMRKLRNECQQNIILRDEINQDNNAEEQEEAKTEIQDILRINNNNSNNSNNNNSDNSRSSIPQQAKVATIIPASLLVPGAVRVAGIDAMAASSSSELMMDPEHGNHDNSIDHSTGTHIIQIPQPTLPEYFQEPVLLEATLVTSRHSRLRNSEMTTSACFAERSSDNSLVFEAKPLHGAHSDLRCSDVVRSKRLCSRIFVCAILFGGIVLAIVLPLVLTRLGARDDEPYEDETPDPKSRANLWLSKDPINATYSSRQREQRLALATFFYRMGGDNWTRSDKWLDYNTNECNWYMAHGKETSCNPEGILVEFNLTSNNMNGTFGEEMYTFSKLNILDVSNNHLYGSAPPFSLDAQEMEVVDISYNAFLSGTYSY
jgi:hypothetical protein